MRLFVWIILFSSPLALSGQIPDAILSPTISSVQLHIKGDQLGIPIIRPNSIEQLELHFDDLDPSVRNYSYTFQLCNADWTPAMLSQFDFLKGFSQIRINTYRVSSIAFTRYIHYQAVLPDRNCIPIRSGNYLLKVFRDGDTAKLAFTRRILVIDDKAKVTGQIQQPFNGQLFQSHQKVQLRVSLSEQLSVVNHLQQVKVMILQNNRWDNAITDLKPTLFSRNIMEFNTENDCIFPAGKEWRWLDLRSLRLQSDRVMDAKYSTSGTEVFVKPDMDRSKQRFSFFRDNNGRYTINTIESINPYWQADYANVHFAFVAPNNQQIPGREVHIIGQLTNYEISDKTKMVFNPDRGAYEITLKLKQGYYDYAYITFDRTRSRSKAEFDYTEGNYWESENDYTILVYYRALGGRADELIGIGTINSLQGRNGF